MGIENVLVLVIGGFTISLQLIVILMLKIGMGKVAAICSQITSLQFQMNGKASLDDSKRVQVTLGEYGDRILTLELAVKVIEKDKG